MTPVERAALALSALPFLTLGLAHVALRRLKLKPGMNLIAAGFLMLRQVGRLASGIFVLFAGIWLAGKHLDPAAFAVFRDQPLAVFVLMGSAMLAYLYLFIRWCWQIWRLRRRPQEYAK